MNKKLLGPALGLALLLMPVLAHNHEGKHGKKSCCQKNEAKKSCCKNKEAKKSCCNKQESKAAPVAKATAPAAKAKH